MAMEYAHYAEGFEPGDRVKVSGTPLHNGKVGTVVQWRWREWGGVRPGLVPVFMPEFPSTHFWWFSPAQLTKLTLRCPTCKGELLQEDVPLELFRGWRFSATYTCEACRTRLHPEPFKCSVCGVALAPGREICPKCLKANQEASTI